MFLRQRFVIVDSLCTATQVERLLACPSVPTELHTGHSPCVSEILLLTQAIIQLGKKAAAGEMGSPFAVMLHHKGTAKLQQDQACLCGWRGDAYPLRDVLNFAWGRKALCTFTTKCTFTLEEGYSRVKVAGYCPYFLHQGSLRLVLCWLRFSWVNLGWPWNTHPLAPTCTHVASPVSPLWSYLAFSKA